VLLEQADWFEKDIDLFRAIIRPGDKILDLGANVGVYSISAAKRAGDRGMVISMEPCTVTYGLLTNSAGPFSNIKVIHAAAADVSGRGVLEPDSGPEMMRLGALDGAGEEVDIITVDELADREGTEYFDLIKMDVEGVEERVLAGAKRTLGNSDPVILFEITEAGIGLVEVFRKLGFDSYYYCPPP
jgi:FkbM family methyltransferase